MSAPQTPSMRTLQSLPNRSFFFSSKYYKKIFGIVVAASWRILLCLLHIFNAIKLSLVMIKE